MIVHNIPDGYKIASLDNNKIFLVKNHEIGTVLEDNNHVYIYHEITPSNQIRVYNKATCSFFLKNMMTISDEARVLSYVEKYKVLHDISMKTNWVVIGDKMFQTPKLGELCLCFNSIKDYKLAFYDDSTIVDIEETYYFTVAIENSHEYNEILKLIEKYFPENYADSEQQEDK